MNFQYRKKCFVVASTDRLADLRPDSPGSRVGAAQRFQSWKQNGRDGSFRQVQTGAAFLVRENGQTMRPAVEKRDVRKSVGVRKSKFAGSLRGAPSR